MSFSEPPSVSVTKPPHPATQVFTGGPRTHMSPRTYTSRPSPRSDGGASDDSSSPVKDSGQTQISAGSNRASRAATNVDGGGGDNDSAAGGAAAVNLPEVPSEERRLGETAASIREHESCVTLNNHHGCGLLFPSAAIDCHHD
jgi:hypothetical protein